MRANGQHERIDLMLLDECMPVVMITTNVCVVAGVTSSVVGLPVVVNVRDMLCCHSVA